ncbi:DUF3168 domain-containing protein [Azospirillum argentinense]
MSNASWALQVATVNAVRTAVGAVKVFDGQAPADTAFPYVVVGEKTITPWDSLAKAGEDIDLTIHVWDRPSGSSAQECERVLALIRGAMNRKRLTLDGIGPRAVRVVFEHSFTEPDGKTRHGLIRIRALVRP